MKVSFFSAKPYDRQFFDQSNAGFGFDFEYFETHLGPHIVNAVENTDVVCVFVNDKCTREVIHILAARNVRIIALRCAGFNNVDLKAAKEYGIRVCRVPAYSPEAVAEYTVALLLTLIRNTHKAYNRVREQNFSLNGLLGLNIHRKTIGVIGTGKIGKAFSRIMLGFGATVIAYDTVPDPALREAGVAYDSLENVLGCGDIISLHCPLTKDNYHLIHKGTLSKMKTGVILINTSRGGLICTSDIIEALKSHKVRGLAIDVYEQEENLFFRDLSDKIIDDDEIQRLMSFPNVLITGHQAFFTSEAMSQIAQVTLENIQKLMKSDEPADGSAILV
ncbi:2-hydroxyacid dehydrogenase [Flavitalea sp. BT771]|uniref:2-hydroxyacid dehydrogenase n=1 Tax=Flavitalea sp. BT771 TaxID=3063329 RepID=UPI0026E24B5C|nr:2-hydroxyacid dehydrogenase [Flavitalea sp. BT771]MDO6430854.1 2-hydroxyacid dehydrogenase [Flavitalea sp. BT771]MDV6219006.1 2-hydroxyacid dehydrogenase [Flavitalea sp. BT771]